MEFNKKLQNLRKGRKLTQEQLAQKLHISRTAVSKWENSRGFPNIEALKNISKFFQVPIDQLLSGEELLDAADQDNRNRQIKLINLIFGFLDVILISLIFLPLYGKQVGDYIQAVNLLHWTTEYSYIKNSYYILFIWMCFFGAVEIIVHFFNFEKIQKALRVSSLTSHSIVVLFFSSTREPYVSSLLFLLLLLKIVILLRKT